MFGRLTWSAFKHDAVQSSAVIGMVVLGLLIIGLITYLKRWKWLWDEWLTTVDPKKIGIMYFVVVILMLLKGLVDAWMMRVQQAIAVGDSQGYLTADHYQEIFSAHGTTMIFFVGMGTVFGLMNLVIPLQIGARDVAYPFLNAASFWLFAAGGMLLMISLAIGHFSATGWLAYPPLSGLEYNPGEGVDYWIWIVQIAGIGSTLSGINFLVTIIKMRCPGMGYMTMPIFVWSALGALLLIVFAFPILTATLGMLTLDRYLGMHFFTAGYAGNPMMYINLIWAWGHPEVYILILPAFGVYSEIVPTFCEKRLFGYPSMVIAIMAIVFLSFIVWLHHFFTMGSETHVNGFFAVATMVIAIPTGVKIFNWLFTEFRGRVHFPTPMMWFLAFIFNFSVAGMTGVLLSVPPVDFQVHNSLFLIAHFHGMVIGGMLFGIFAGFTYWFPKMTGYRLDEKLGHYAFWCWFIGFLVAFMPLYMLGFMGATRRLNHYEVADGWHNLLIVVCFGVGLIMCGIGFQLWQIYKSIRYRARYRDLTGDPWNGRTLEWSIPSPPPIYNFAIIPKVEQKRDAFWAMKQGEIKVPAHPKYEDIHLPKNSHVPVLLGIFALLFGFAMTWLMYWLAIVSLIGIIVSLVARLSLRDEQIYYTLPAEEVKKIEKSHREEFA